MGREGEGEDGGGMSGRRWGGNKRERMERELEGGRGNERERMGRE
jgi:hypothetical protein